MFLLCSFLQYAMVSVLTIFGCPSVILHVRDAQTDELVRELARSRGISITDAIREAVEEALAQDRKKLSLWDRTAHLRARMERYPSTGETVNKSFYDSLSGQEGDD